jgi:hypothetical protein
MKVWSERHAPSRNSRGARRMRSVCCMGSSCWRERVELPFEVATLNVVAPLALALDGDVVVFTITTAVEFGPVVSCSDACRWYTRHY